MNAVNQADGEGAFSSHDSATVANPQAAGVGWRQLIVLVFLAGGTVAAVRFAWGVASVRRLARSGHPVDDSELEKILREMHDRLALPCAVTVRESSELATPATVGWRWPVVLLPTSWREWSNAELRAVIAHELAHIAGRDYPAWLIARLAVVAHFYHPLVRWLAARLQLEQELAADIAAAQLVGDSKQYLHSLATLALAMPATQIAGPARTLFPTRSLLVRRVEMLRSNGANRPRRGVARFTTFAIVAIVALAAAGLRGGGGSSAKASAETPADEQPSAENGTDESTRSIGLEIAPEDTTYLLSVSPAELSARKDVGPLVTALAASTIPLRAAELSADDVTAVMIMSYGKVSFPVAVAAPFGGQMEASPPKTRIVVRFRARGAQEKFTAAYVRDNQLDRAADNDSLWQAESQQLQRIDSTTVVIDRTDGKKIADIAPLKNKLPAWADVWSDREEEAIVFAVNVEQAWTTLGQNIDPVQTFGEGPFQTLYPLIMETSWMVADLDLEDGFKLGGVIQAKDGESAVTVGETLQAGVVLLRNAARLYEKAQPQGADGNPAPDAEIAIQKQIASAVDNLLKSAKVDVDDSRVNLSLGPSMSTPELAEFVQKMLPSVADAREAARLAQSINNIKNLQLAMLTYESARRVLPTGSGHHINGEVRRSEHPHSWRVELLPYLDQKALYDQYRFDEPWDSEANKKVLNQMPEVFRSPHDDSRSTNTSYFVFTGPDTLFPTEGRVKFSRVADGISRTISIVEVKRPVPWTKPEDIEYAADQPAPKLEGWLPGKFLAAIADGSVRTVAADIDEATLRAWITKAGREQSEELPGPR